MTNGNDSAYPNEAAKWLDESEKWELSGLTKREYFAAMAKVPEMLFENEINKWKGDNGEAPQLAEYQSYERMLKNLATIEARYKALQADALLIELNKSPQT